MTDHGQAPPDGDYPVPSERAGRRLCACGWGDIEWRLYPPLPFPDHATEEQLTRQRKGGRWVHVDDEGDDFSEWCPPQRPRPAS